MSCTGTASRTTTSSVMSVHLITTTSHSVIDVTYMIDSNFLQNDDKAPIGLNVDTIGDGDTQMPPESIVGMFEKMMEV